MNSYSATYNRLELSKIREIFEKDGAIFEQKPYMEFQARGENYVASYYCKGKFLIQGAKTQRILELLGISGAVLADCTNNANFSVDKSQKSAQINTQTTLMGTGTQIKYPHIGTDESGKGDFFGPLCTAGVYMTEEQAKKFSEMGVCDSKKLTDEKIEKLAIVLKNEVKYDVVTINPKKYNELYNNFKNLNKLLAWAHATVIENLISKTDAKTALCDQFGSERFILNALKTQGKQIELLQMPKAEQDTAVAAASILARNEFVKNIEKMGKKYGFKFPKGASNLVENCAKNFIEKNSIKELENVCKTHFITYKKVTK